MHTVPVTLAGKDPSLVDVVKRLYGDLGSDYFVVSDSWQDDLIAVGLAKPDDAAVLVYVALRLDPTSQGPDGKLLDGMYFDCEVPTADGLSDVVASGDGVGYSEVLAAVRTHLAP
jgi:hypothetical protein